MAQKKSSGSDGNDDEIRELERQLSEAKKKKQIEDLESEIASLKAKNAKKESVIIVRGKAVPAGSRKMSTGAKVGIGIAVAFGLLVSCVALVSQTDVSDISTEASDGPPLDCLAVPTEVIDAIASGTDDTNEAVPLSVSNSAAWKGPEGFFVALQYEDEGGNQRKGVWLRWDRQERNDIKYGLILAADAAAKLSTVYPDAASFNLDPVDVGNSGIGNAISCLEGSQ